MQAQDKVCPIVEAINRIGGEWKLIVIRHLMDGPMRFNQLLRASGADPKTLTRVLRQLEDEGVVEREVVSTRPFKVVYSLTQKGQDLRPTLEALRQWGEKWVQAEPQNPPLTQA